MSDDNIPVTHTQRPILHLPRSKLNGSGVARKPDGEIRHEQMVEESQNPSPPEQER